MTYEQSASVLASAAKTRGPWAEIPDFFLETGLHWVAWRTSEFRATSNPQAIHHSVLSDSDGYEPKSTKSCQTGRVPRSPRLRDMIERHISSKTSDALLSTCCVAGRLNGTNI